jgi:hypothetical protein
MAKVAVDSGMRLRLKCPSPAPGTLRECLENALSGQTITFDPAIFLPDTPATIALTNPLPVITQGNLTIDGTSAGVIIDGSGIAEDANCLLLASNGNTVRGLRIGECAWCGVSVSGADNTVADNVLFSSAGAGVALWGTDTYSNIVTGNYIGTDAEGTAGLGNGTGVWISYGAHDNIVGGYTPAERNVISNNGGSGVAISRSGTDGNLVVGNYIGTNPAGTAGLGNVFDGVWIGEGAQYNTIEGNIISANGANGVVIGGAGSDGNAIVGNLIGLAADGATPLGSSASGVDIRNGAQGNTVGGDTPGERNVISGNGRGGVVVENGGTENNMITGNYIGTDVSGTVALGNGAGAGVHIKDGTKSNVVGGDTPEERNIICGNETGVWITGSGTTNNIVSGNYIGTDVSGTASLRNNGPGVDIREGAQNNTIGGTTAGERNVISGKNYYGVVIEDSGTDFNTVSGNYIGTDATGTTALGNMNDGVGISGAKSNIIERNLISSNDLSGVCISGSDTMSNVVSDNLIGTDASGTADLGNGSHGVALFDGAQQNVIGEGNVIAYNKGHGIGVWNPTTLYNTITRNSIHSNTGMGIDNANGGNTELPPLVITEAVGMTVSGTACAGCTLEFFSDDENEGRVFEGSTIAEGDGTFTFSRTESFTGPNVTATATDADGNTSEFSAPVSVPVLIIEPDVGTYGTKFDTTGSGWAPVEVVTVEWFWPDGSLVTSRDYTADAYGNINPSDWVAGVGEPAGTYACTATGPTSGSVTKTFEVLPATEPLLAVWPDSGVVGETFYICGSGFQSSENITLTFTGPTTATLNLTADEEGNLFYIEWDSTGYLWGTYTLEAVGDQGSTTSATFEILPIQIYLPLVTKNYQ